jgi:hypothetical protein
MKRFLIIYGVIFTLAIPASAQFLKGKKAPGRTEAREKQTLVSAIGIAGGITYGEQIWNPEGPLAQERYRLSFNAAVLAEFFHHPHYRWRTELEYNQMGTRELLYIPAGQYTVNKTNYFQFNNYLKIIYKETKFIPYLLLGPRIEYLFMRSAGVYPDIIGQFHLFQVTVSAGAGMEIAWKSSLRPFIEGFYNHDLLPSLRTVASPTEPITDINYHAWELRLGLKYFFGGRSDSCPPVINPAGN